MALKGISAIIMFTQSATNRLLMTISQSPHASQLSIRCLHLHTAFISPSSLIKNFTKFLLFYKLARDVKESNT